MAISFDEYWNGVKQRASAKGVSPSLDIARQKYREKFNEPAIFQSGPTRTEFKAKARKQSPDLTDDQISDAYDKAYSEPILGELWRSTKRGGAALGQAVGGLMEVSEEFAPMNTPLGLNNIFTALRGINPAEDTRKFWQEKRDRVPKSVSSQTPVMQEPGQLANPDWWAANLPETATSQIMPAIAGFLAGGPLGAGLAGGMMEAQDTFTSAKDQKLGDLGARTLLTGTTSAALNAIPFMKGAGVLGSAVKEGVTEMLEEPFATVAENPWPKTAEDLQVLGSEAVMRMAEVGPLAAVLGGATAPSVTGGRPAQASKKASKKFIEEIESIKTDQPATKPQGKVEPTLEPAQELPGPDYSEAALVNEIQAEEAAEAARGEAAYVPNAPKSAGLQDERIADPFIQEGLAVRAAELADSETAPAWMAELGSLERVQKALDKAQQGQPLGKRQAEIVRGVIDRVDAERGAGPYAGPGGRQGGAINFGAIFGAKEKVAETAEVPSYTGIRPFTGEKIAGGGGEINTRKFMNLGNDGLGILQQVANDFDAGFATQRRGKRTWDTTERAAMARISSTTGIALDELLSRKVGSAANAEQLESYAKIISEQAERIKDKAKAIDEGQDSSDDLLEWKLMNDELAILQAPFAGYVAEAGRALNIMKKVTVATGEARAMLDIMNVSGGSIAKAAKRVAQGDAVNAAKTARQAFEPGFWDKLIEFRQANLLTGYKTLLVNFFGNSSHLASEMVAQYAGALYKGHTFRQANATIRGMMKGTMLGTTNFGRAIKTGQAQLEPMTKFDTERQGAISGLKGELIRIPFRGLTATDEFFKGVGFLGRLYGVATRESEKLGGSTAEVDSRADEFITRIQRKMKSGEPFTKEENALVKEGIDYARHVTFQDPLGPISQAVNTALNKSKVGKIIVPFFKTPVNLVKRAGEYSPLGFIQPVWDEKSGRNALTDEQRAMLKGRATIGTVLAAWTLDMVAQGLLSGLVSDDPRERALEEQATGKRMYSAKGKDGRWYSYLRLDPFAIQTGIMTDMYELWDYMDKGDQGKIPAYLMMSMMNNLGNKTWLAGISEFAEFVNDPTRYGERYTQGMVLSTAVPNILTQLASNQDPYLRQASTLLDAAKKKIPGKRQELARINSVAGQPLENPYQDKMPFASVDPKNDPLAKKMLELGVIKGKPGKRVGGVELDPEQYEDYTAFVGANRWNILSQMIQSPGFSRMPPSMQAVMLERQWDALGTKARQAWLVQNYEVVRAGKQAKIDQFTGQATTQ